MRNPGGYFISVDPDPTRSKGQRAVREADTFGCAHCGAHTFVKPFCDPAEAGGMCRQCGGLTCPRCTAEGRCIPLEKRLEQEEARYHARRSYEECA